MPRSVAESNAQRPRGNHAGRAGTPQDESQVMKANWTPWVIFPALFLLGIEAVQGQQARPDAATAAAHGSRGSAAAQADLQYAPAWTAGISARRLCRP